MNNIKKFWNDHKVVICVIGGSIAVMSTGYFLRKTLGKYWMISKEENVIHWKNNNKYMNLERVKEILDLNKDNGSAFAIFREGSNPNEYATIVLDNAKDFVDVP